MRALVAVLAAVASLAVAVAASAARPVAVVFKPLAPGPRVGVNWPYRLTVTQGGKRVKAVLTMTLVDPILQVHQVTDVHDRPIRGRVLPAGVFTDKILFPAESKGFTLTLRFAVTAAGARKVTEVKVTPR